MNKPAIQSHIDTRSSVMKVRKNLAARHRKNRYFRQVARASLLFAAAMLCWLLLSLLSTGIQGFFRHELTLSIDTKPMADALKNAPDTINYNALLHASLRDMATQQNNTPKDKAQLRQLYMLAGTFAALDVKQQLLGAVNDNTTSVRVSERVNVPERVNVNVPLSDNADQYLKGAFSKVANPHAIPLSDQQRTWLDGWQKAGAAQRAFNTELFTRGDSRAPESAGLGGSVVGSLLLVLVCMLCALPLGVMSAVYLEEYAKKNLLSELIEVTINNLAAVPSIIFGLLGLSLYLILLGLPRSSALVGGLTLSFMVLPVIILTTRAALKAVPPSIRHGAIALGASPLQVVLHHVLPYALPGIMTGTILGIARALGETAPLLMIGMVAFVADIPRGITDPATVLPVQIYLWASSPELGFIEKTASAILVLLTVLLLLNAAAHTLRSRYEIRW